MSEIATGQRGPLKLLPMISAPRDGTHVLVFQREMILPSDRSWPGGPRIPLPDPPETYLTATEARVVTTWVTNEFIPAHVAEGDRSGLNHGALVEDRLIGWLPMPEMP